MLILPIRGEIQGKFSAFIILLGGIIVNRSRSVWSGRCIPGGQHIPFCISCIIVAALACDVWGTPDAWRRCKYFGDHPVAGAGGCGFVWDGRCKLGREHTWFVSMVSGLHYSCSDQSVVVPAPWSAFQRNLGMVWSQRRNMSGAKSVDPWYFGERTGRAGSVSHGIEQCRAIRILGVLQRFEALLAASVLMGAFCILLLSGNRMAEALDILLPQKPRVMEEWHCDIAGVSFWNGDFNN